MKTIEKKKKKAMHSYCVIPAFMSGFSCGESEILLHFSLKTCSSVVHKADSVQKCCKKKKSALIWYKYCDWKCSLSPMLLWHINVPAMSQASHLLKARLLFLSPGFCSFLSPAVPISQILLIRAWKPVLLFCQHDGQSDLRFRATLWFFLLIFVIEGWNAIQT